MYEISYFVTEYTVLSTGTMVGLLKVLTWLIFTERPW